MAASRGLPLTSLLERRVVGVPDRAREGRAVKQTLHFGERSCTPRTLEDESVSHHMNLLHSSCMRTESLRGKHESTSLPTSLQEGSVRRHAYIFWRAEEVSRAGRQV